MKQLNKKQIIWLSVGIFTAVALLTLGTLAIISQSAKNDTTWAAEDSPEVSSEEPVESESDSAEPEDLEEPEPTPAEPPAPSAAETPPASTTPSDGSNCTLKFGNLMLINPNFTVTTDFIARRATELISLSKTYGIPEHHSYNGDNLLDPTAAEHLNDMVKAYEAEYPGHTMGTMSCFRRVGTSCGRLCLATGTSEHHSGYTCDLIDTAYGSILNTDDYSQHLEWQWLRANSYKYGFIERYPLAWAGGPMSEPMNLDATGTTGLYETWHYRYVGIAAATDIALGRYNNGAYDSLEHYLLMTGRVANLLTATCY